MSQSSRATKSAAAYDDRRKPAVLWTLALFAAANAVWMLADPAAWFVTLPGVADTGPLNQHLVRDVGCARAVGGGSRPGAPGGGKWRIATGRSGRTVAQAV